MNADDKEPERQIVWKDLRCVHCSPKHARRATVVAHGIALCARHFATAYPGYRFGDLLPPSTSVQSV